MRNQIFNLSASFAVLFMVVFMIGSVSQSITIPEKAVHLDPTVVRTNPADGEMNVPRNTIIVVLFSEELDSTARQNSTFTLTNGSESAAGTLEFLGDRGIFRPMKNLVAETVYTANIMVVIKQSGSDHSDDEFNDEQPIEEYSAGIGMEWSFTTGGNNGPVEKVDLGSAAEFVILAHSSIHDKSTPDVSGIKGFATASKNSNANNKVEGLNNEAVEKNTACNDTTREKSENGEFSSSDVDINSGSLDEALQDMMTAYTNAAERTSIDFINYKIARSGEHIGTVWKYSSEDGMNIEIKRPPVVLAPGIYKWESVVEILTDITLSGDAEDVWIFQIPEGLTVNSNVKVLLSDGAVAEHIFWQVAGEVTIGNTAHFEGIILSQKGIAMGNGATLNGHIFAQTDITLDDNRIIEPRLQATAQGLGSNK
ncbi:ice-binding family protein [Rhodohalobacter sp.]|uniref:ice-binding family protein n=1 Tax=Rhodohalobacter sp. TaxID=1974210 RepID=UPI002ACEAD30|nr:ice-binding family protein [Rhodohalobacter sp.]MDZ7755814.1 ice-binding family protein [Rhodohalobacter sp.]